MEEYARQLGNITLAPHPDPQDTQALLEWNARCHEAWSVHDVDYADSDWDEEFEDVPYDAEVSEDHVLRSGSAGLVSGALAAFFPIHVNAF